MSKLMMGDCLELIMPHMLLHGDCLDLMAQIPDGSVDMILCDLPYGTTACKWDTVIPFAPLWAHYRRAIKPSGAIVLFGSQPFTSALVMSNINEYRHQWVWNKNNSAGFATAKIRPMAICEDILVFGKRRVNYYPQMIKGKMRKKGGYGASDNYGITPTISVNDDYYPKNLIEIGNASQVGKVHPTQKPVALMEYLIKTYTNEGETVMDNCMGSGTTGVACMNTGRKFIGMEQDAEYFQVARARIESATPIPEWLQ